MANLGGDFIPKNDMGFISIAVDRSSGVSLEEMEKSMHELNAIITEDTPEVENIYANFGANNFSEEILVEKAFNYLKIISENLENEFDLNT